ncbi:spermine/spermidine synthase domain-containing protein [Oceanithermus sp.]
MLELKQELNPNDRVFHEIEEVLAVGRTAWQHYLFFKSAVHGVCVALDGDLQSCSGDEGIYHEALVQPAMLAHPEPRRVLIMGGGEGATLREVLRHPSVKRVVMVDLDEEFVNLCRRLLPDWAAGGWEDERLELRHQDIAEYLDETEGGFDVVIGDLIDATEPGSPASRLYGSEFYQKLAAALAPGAVLATQAGPLAVTALSGHRRARASLRQVFPAVWSYGAVVPSFYNLWGFVLAGAKEAIPNDACKRQALFAERARERGLELEYLGPAALAAAFTLPRKLAAALEVSGGQA